MAQKTSVFGETKSEAFVASKYINNILTDYSANWLSVAGRFKKIVNLYADLPATRDKEILLKTIEQSDINISKKSTKPGLAINIFHRFKNNFLPVVIDALIKKLEQDFIKKFTRKIITKAFAFFDETQREIFVFLYVDGFKIQQICELVHSNRPAVLKKLHTCRITVASAIATKADEGDKLSEKNYILFINYFENALTPDEEETFLSRVESSDLLKKEFNLEIQLRYFIDKKELLGFYTQDSKLPTVESLSKLTKHFELVYKPINRNELKNLFSANEIKMAKKISDDPSISNKELAKALGMEERTIDSLRKRFLGKINDNFFTDFTSPQAAAAYLLEVHIADEQLR